LFHDDMLYNIVCLYFFTKKKRRQKANASNKNKTEKNINGMFNFAIVQEIKLLVHLVWFKSQQRYIFLDK